MKPGLGLYRHMLTRDNFRFARQVGASHVVAHLVDYFRAGSHASDDDQPTGDEHGWGRAGDPDRLWSVAELVDLRRAIESEGLKLEAIENFDPAHWHDVLLDGPRRDAQLENCKTVIRRLGEAGIPIMGYNFSLAGVTARQTGPMARGGAEAVGVDGGDDRPLPVGMVWNMVYDSDAAPGTLAAVTPAELWRRYQVFLDDGETDMLEVLRILHRNNFEGVVIPDHTPRLTCASPWHAGMAHALGWILAALRALDRKV